MKQIGILLILYSVLSCESNPNRTSIADQVHEELKDGFITEYFENGNIKSSRYVAQGEFDAHQIYYHNYSDTFRVIDNSDTSLIAISRVKQYQYIEDSLIIYEAKYGINRNLISRFGQAIIGFNKYLEQEKQFTNKI